MCIIKDARIWQDMAGDNELEKRLNSYLTVQFVIKEDVPYDECLSEAREIIKIVAETKVGDTFAGQV